MRGIVYPTLGQSVLTPPVNPNAGWGLTPYEQTAQGRADAVARAAKAADLSREARERQQRVVEEWRARDARRAEEAARQAQAATRGYAQATSDPAENERLRRAGFILWGYGAPKSSARSGLSFVPSMASARTPARPMPVPFQQRPITYSRPGGQIGGIDGVASYPLLGGESAEALVDRLTQQAMWKLRAEAGLEGGEGLGFIALIGAALSIVGSIVQAQQAKKQAAQQAKLAAAQNAAEAALIKAQQEAEDLKMKNELQLIAAREGAATAGPGGIPGWVLPVAAAGVGVVVLGGVLAFRSRK